MSARSNRAVAAATAVALALTATGIPAFAASKSAKNEQAQQATTVDLSAAKRKVRRHRGVDPAGAAVLGAVTGLFGAIAANAAADRYRHRYYQPYYDPYGGYYYQPQPYYYRHPYWR
jgi:hypothetical protein